MKFDTFVDLLPNALRGVAIRGCECLVRAEGTAARRDSPITIGAPQRGIDRELLHPTAHQLSEIGGVTIETTGILRFVIHNCEFIILKFCALSLRELDVDRCATPLIDRVGFGIDLAVER